MSMENIYDYLERIANLLRTDTRKAGLGKGLQPVQLEALRYLANCNRYSNTPAAVADYLGLTKGTVSQTLGVLENTGLVEKLPDAKDRRVVHLKVTELGMATLAETLPPQTLQMAMALLSKPEQEQALAVLGRLLRAMQQANRLRSFGACKTCRHHRIEAEGQHRCNLTGEILQLADGEQICREHDPPAVAE